MWWIFGLINMIVVMGFVWFYHKKIKDGDMLTTKDKVAIFMMLVLAFLGGIVGTFIIFVIFIYLIIDFAKFVKNRGK